MKIRSIQIITKKVTVFFLKKKQQPRLYEPPPGVLFKQFWLPNFTTVEEFSVLKFLLPSGSMLKKTKQVGQKFYDEMLQKYNFYWDHRQPV